MARTASNINHHVRAEIGLILASAQVRLARAGAAVYEGDVGTATAFIEQAGREARRAERLLGAPEVEVRVEYDFSGNEYPYEVIVNERRG